MVSADDTSWNFSAEVKVRLPETDAMGIVFHGNFFTYFEVGRVEYLSNLGLTEGGRPIRDFENVVVSAHCDFKSPARLHDVLVIDVRTKSLGRSSFTFEFRLRHKAANRMVAQGHTIHCAVDDAMKPIAIPEAFRQTLRGFEGRDL